MQPLTEFQASLLARALADTTGYLVGMQVDLFQTPIAILPTTPLATFTAAIATYTGYAQHIMVWDLPSLDETGQVQVVGTAVIFRPTGTAIGNSIYGCYCTDAVSGDLLFAGAVDNAPVPMNSSLNLLQLQIIFRPASNSFVVTVI
jgi:hypothetical protein